MKKLLCLCLSVLLCLSVAAAEVYVPTSSTKLPDMLDAPVCPEIIRVQKADGAVTFTLSAPLPDDALVIALGLDAEYMRYIALAESGEGNTCTADGLPQGGEWTGFEIDWPSGDMKAVAHYNAAGGLESVTCYDRNFNEYNFDNEGRFCEFAYADDSVRVRFNTRGVMTSYGYKALRSMTVWFTEAGDVVCAEYDDGDGGIVADWEPGYGWFVDTPEGRVKLKLDVPSPWDARRLLPGRAVEKTEVTHYPNNTICVAGLTLKEADPSLPDKWYNVLPVDLTKDGRSVYQLVISNMFYIGEVYVDVWGDEVTVSCALVDSTAVQPLQSYGRWFTSLGDITSTSIEATEGGFIFGEPLSIAEDLGGADTALLFIRSKATYYQPFKDGTTLTRYWRNRTEWKEFREGLQELMPRVEK